MAKTYQVKVFSQTDTFITTWTDVISDISFSNEINSAGGQLQMSLGRNAGDYGEGTDVDFGLKVKVYCFDTEEPDGLLIFQGYISAYTPVYKDDKVEIIILGYGAELDDFILEGGDTVYITQASQNKTYQVGDTSGFGQIQAIVQTFVVAADTTVSAVSLMLTNSVTTSYLVVLTEYNGVTVDVTTDSKLAYGSITVPAGSGVETKIVLDNTADLSSTKYYYIRVYSTSSWPVFGYVHATNTNPYAGGKVWTVIFGGTTWNTISSTAADDLYFKIYAYGGTTTVAYTADDPIVILEDVLAQYNSQGGQLVEPPLPYTPLVGSLLKGTTQNQGSWGTAYAQVFEVATTTKINIVQLYGTTPFIGASLQIYQGDPSLDLFNVIAGSQSYTLNYAGGSNTLIASTTYNSATGQYEFLTPPTLTVGLSYYFLIIYSSLGGDVLLGASTFDLPILTTGVGKQYRSIINANNTSSAMAYNTTYPALYFNIYYIDPVPADINGGYILTDTSVSYTFKVNTILEAIDKLKDLSPENWYWYVDQGNNILQFKEKSDDPQHFFSLEKDLIDAKFEKRIENVINTVYFTGGAVSPGVNYFKKYIDAESIATYGVKSMKYSDSNVITDATADLIGNNIIATKSQPELRVTLEILDSNNNQGLGYDIESLQVGDVIAVRNITQQVGLSTWDVGKWDQDYWDYNIYNLSSLRMQIEKIEYKQDTAIVSASNIPVDINKRIEQVNRSIQALQTVNNPAAPS